VSSSRTSAIDVPILVPGKAPRIGRTLLPWLMLTLLAGALAAVGGSLLSAGPVHARRARTPAYGARVKLPAAASLAVSRGLGADLAGYRLVRAPGGFLARNPRQRLTASFGARGATVSARDGAHASIALQAIGSSGAALHAVGSAQPLARSNRVEYRRGGATEWFANGPAGVEQGFTLANAPSGAADGALTLELRLSGTLTARPSAAGGLVLTDAGGKAVLRYGELSVSDARGKALPARMTLAHGRLLISVDTRGARYPLTVDPLMSVAELYASAGKEEEELGYSVAASGHTVVAGAPAATVGGHKSAGAAYVFTEGPSGWSSSTQAAELLPSTSEEDAEFGHSVAISGKTIVVGSPRATAIGPDNGAAFVFSEPTAAGGWSSTAVQHQAAVLWDTEDQAFPEFGKSVAIVGETIVVGSPSYVNYIYKQTTFREHPQVGAAFIFVQPAGGWSSKAQQYQSFTLMETEKEYVEYEEDDFFGASVAIDETGGEQTVVVTASDAKVEGHFQQGAAFIFNRPNAGWTGSPLESSPGATLTNSNGVAHEKLGEASGKGLFGLESQTVAISGNEIVVGAPEAKDGSNEYEGAAYVFAEPAGGWEAERAQYQAAKLLPADGKADSLFGKSVAAESPTVMVGSAGNGYVYSMPAGGWSGEPHQGSELEGFVSSVSLVPGYAMVGELGRKPPKETGHTLQGDVEVIPLGPIVTTGSTSATTTSAATIEGSVAPNRDAVSMCVFQYGTSAAYGAEVPCAQNVAGEGSTPTTVTAALTGLTPNTTYHYRVIATNADGTSYGLDRTFTTSHVGEQVENKEEPSPGKPAEEPSKTGTTTTGTSSTTTASVAPAAVSQLSPVLACTTAQVALINVVTQGSHVLITGAARLVLAGKRVSIKFLATGKTVASATIAANGTFSASAPLPPAKLRETNRARYEASVGSLHSLNLKLDRRMYMVSATRSGTHVLLSGYVTGSFKAGTKVKILLRVTCSKEEVIANVKLTSTGKFSATVPAPIGATSQIAVYRATTTVLKDGHPEPTFTLPTPPSG
jgi:hypothetical protein